MVVGEEIEGRGGRGGVSRIEEESESEEDHGESHGCDRPILLRPLSPPTKPRICHCFKAPKKVAVESSVFRLFVFIVTKGMD